MTSARAAPRDLDLRAALDAGPAVVKLGGAALEAKHASAPVWRFLADLAARCPQGLILVHGGGAAVDRHLARLGLPTTRRDGIRLTPPDQIDQVVATLAGLVNKTLVAALARQGARAVGLCLGDGGIARAAVDQSLGFDPGRVGACTGGDPHLLRTLLAAGYVPIVASIAFDEAGEPLNINADRAAAAVAHTTRAGLTLLLTDTPGILDQTGETIATLTSAIATELIATGTVHGGMVVKARAALDVARRSGSLVLIAPWNDADALGSILAGRPSGTLVADTLD